MAQSFHTTTPQAQHSYQTKRVRTPHTTKREWCLHHGYHNAEHSFKNYTSKNKCLLTFSPNNPPIWNNLRQWEVHQTQHIERKAQLQCKYQNMAETEVTWQSYLDNVAVSSKANLLLIWQHNSKSIPTRIMEVPSKPTSAEIQISLFTSASRDLR